MSSFKKIPAEAVSEKMVEMAAASHLLKIMSLLIDFLKGKWLGHPLHPVLVHVPVGVWPAALIFDIISFAGTGGNLLVRTSFFLIAFGLAVALLSIAPGLVDWSGIKKKNPAWKLGLYHMLLNLTATALWSLNLLIRTGDFQTAASVSGTGLLLSVIATVFLFAGGYLGGLMVYEYGISVARMSKKKWRKIAAEGKANLPEEK